MHPVNSTPTNNPTRPYNPHFLFSMKSPPCVSPRTFAGRPDRANQAGIKSAGSCRDLVGPFRDPAGPCQSCRIKPDLAGSFPDPAGPCQSCRTKPGSSLPDQTGSFSNHSRVVPDRHRIVPESFPDLAGILPDRPPRSPCSRKRRRTPKPAVAGSHRFMPAGIEALSALTDGEAPKIVAFFHQSNHNRTEPPTAARSDRILPSPQSSSRFRSSQASCSGVSRMFAPAAHDSISSRFCGPMIAAVGNG